MDDALLVHRLQVAFTITYHYLFPQLTMGLAPLIVIFKSLYLWKGDERYHIAARFWAKIFGITFLFGVITGIPMEFQFGTNWAAFSKYAGGVIGQTLAMEGMFAFFLESAFLGLFLYGEKRLGKVGHWLAGTMVFVGSWLSGYFIIATNAWMQYPVGYTVQADGSVTLNSFWALLLNPWAIYQYLHNMGGALVTGSFAVAALGAYYVSLTKGYAIAHDTARSEGALIYSPSGKTSLALLAGSPAEKAGLLAGDIVTKVNDRDITLDYPLARAIGEISKGTSAELTVLRGTEEKTLPVQL